MTDGFAGPGRHHRRHRVRASRPHARGHPGRPRPRGPGPGRGHAARQPARPAVAAVAGTRGKALVLNTPGLHRRARRDPRRRARRGAPRPRAAGRRPAALAATEPRLNAHGASGIGRFRSERCQHVPVGVYTRDHNRTNATPSRGWVKVPTGGESPRTFGLGPWADPVESRSRRCSRGSARRESGWERGSGPVDRSRPAVVPASSRPASAPEPQTRTT